MLEMFPHNKQLCLTLVNLILISLLNSNLTSCRLKNGSQTNENTSGSNEATQFTNEDKQTQATNTLRPALIAPTPADGDLIDTQAPPTTIKDKNPSPTVEENQRDTAADDVVILPKQTTTTTTTTTTASALTMAKDNEDKSTKISLPECDKLCLNGGECVILESGEMICVCPEGFYGIRCQLRDICKVIIADNLNGDEVCERLGRKCHLDDKLFRCDCDDDEYFIFKSDYYVSPNTAPSSEASTAPAQSQNQRKNSHQTSTFAYDSLLPIQVTPVTSTDNKQMRQQFTDSSVLQRSRSFNTANSNNNRHQQETGQIRQTYLAECRKIDKCLGVRCRQTSEVCHNGACECNQNLGYIRDPVDKLCKLLDPCQMPTPDGQPICGQARCVATYDRELYKCICPIGYNPVKKGEHRSSIQCAMLTDLLCDIPLLNKCQHLCKIDRKSNKYKCSCFPGYKSGSRPDIDDHMCFFDEHIGGPADSEEDSQEDWTANWRVLDQIKGTDSFGSNVNQQPRGASKSDGQVDEDAVIAYDPQPTLSTKASSTRSYKFRPVRDNSEQVDVAGKSHKQWHDVSIKKVQVNDQLEMGLTATPSGRLATLETRTQDPYDDRVLEQEDWDYERYGDESQMSAQDRCNMYCEENKICVLEEGSTDSYRCVCDRQGYVSVGDRCLDWCSAAQFAHAVQSRLAEVCYSGICKRLDERPPRSAGQEDSVFYRTHKFEKLEKERLLASAISSWRPSFECDCSSSPLMYKDPETHLCKLDFEAILKPCLPGNEGYMDCVVNKHSYCTVLHRHTRMFFQDLLAEQLFEKQNSADSSSNQSNFNNQQQQQKFNKKLPRKKEKLYACVCSPEKKFLVDKPRKKARCIDECDLLNNECGRFNRMCRRASIEDDQDFGFHYNLIRFDGDGIRMNQFKRTGCECLPGFNVGPKESRDVTMDDNYSEPTVTAGQYGLSGPGSAANVWPSPEALALSEAAKRLQQVAASAAGPNRALDESTRDTPFVGEIAGGLFAGDFSLVGGPESIERSPIKYININSRCLLDYDVIEFHAAFKAPADFEPTWVKVRNTRPLIVSSSDKSTSAEPSLSSLHAESTSARNEKVAIDASSSESSDTAEGMGGGRSAIEGAAAADQRASPDILKIPAFMRANIDEFHQHAVLVAQCDNALAQLSFEAYQKCLRYRYWVVQKLRRHFTDWRRLLSKKLKETFDLMYGQIRFRVNKCEATIKRISTIPDAYADSLDLTDEFPDLVASAAVAGAPNTKQNPQISDPVNGAATRKLPLVEVIATEFDPLDPFAKVDADLDCELTIHSAADDSGLRRHSRKVLLEKQLPKFIFDDYNLARDESFLRLFGEIEPPNVPENKASDYYLMAPNTLIQRESFDQLAKHRKLFRPCKSDYAYCDKQTRCEMVDTVNYSCTCEYGYTPIGSRDIFLGDSRKEVCEDINECLFDVCKENGLENKSVCVNEIGDYKCQCTRHHVGDNKRYCNHICNVIACKFGDCRIPDEHHAFCECQDGYREADCSVQDPSVALRKANMIICGSIFTSVLLLAITLAISLNSQLKKTKKKLKRLEAAQDAAEFFEFNLQQAPFSRQRVSKTSIGS